MYRPVCSQCPYASDIQNTVMIQTGAQSNEQSLWDDAALLRYVSQTARRVIPVGGTRPTFYGMDTVHPVLKAVTKQRKRDGHFFGADRLTLLDDNDDDNDYNNNNNKSNSRPESWIYLPRV